MWCGNIIYLVGIVWIFPQHNLIIIYFSSLAQVIQIGYKPYIRIRVYSS